VGAGALYVAYQFEVFVNRNVRAHLV